MKNTLLPWGVYGVQIQWVFRKRLLIPQDTLLYTERYRQYSVQKVDFHILMQRWRGGWVRIRCELAEVTGALSSDSNTCSGPASPCTEQCEQSQGVWSGSRGEKHRCKTKTRKGSGWEETRTELRERRGKESLECETRNWKCCFVSVQVGEYRSTTTKCSSFANLCHPP